MATIGIDIPNARLTADLKKIEGVSLYRKLYSTISDNRSKLTAEEIAYYEKMAFGSENNLQNDLGDQINELYGAFLEIIQSVLNAKSDEYANKVLTAIKAINDK